MKLVFLHGAEGPVNSMAAFASKFNATDVITLEYDPDAPWHHSFDHLSRGVQPLGDIAFVAFSLGGLFAYYLSMKLQGQVKFGVTIASPYGGVEYGSMFSTVWPDRSYLKYADTNSWWIQDILGQECQIPWTNIVTTQGSTPWLPWPNDGVVTQSSMMALPKCRFELLDESHMTVLASARAADLVQCLVNQYCNALAVSEI